MNAGHESGPAAVLPKLPSQQIDIAPADGSYPLRRMRPRMAGGLEQLGDNLGVGLAAEPNPVEGGYVSNLLSNGRDDSAAGGAVGQENGAVDVEEDELGGHEKAVYLSSSLLTATNRSLRPAALVPGSQGSTTMPPQESVE